MRLKNKARVLGQNVILNYRENWESFLLSETSQINFETYRARDYYRVLLVKKHQSPHIGPERWKRDISIDTENWTDVFKMASKICKENKLKEFQFKFIHRIVITKKELFRYGINTDSDCIYCGEPDSINHTFVDCEFTKTFTNSHLLLIIRMFPTFNQIQRKCFLRPLSTRTYKKLVRKFNYTLLFMKFYVYASKLKNSSPVLNEFITRVNYKYKVENL